MTMQTNPITMALISSIIENLQSITIIATASIRYLFHKHHKYAYDNVEKYIRGVCEVAGQEFREWLQRHYFRIRADQQWQDLHHVWRQ